MSEQDTHLLIALLVLAAAGFAVVVILADIVRAVGWGWTLLGAGIAATVAGVRLARK